MPPDTAEEWHVHHRAHQFFYVLEGQATMRMAEEKIVLSAGAGIQVPPGAPHQMANLSSKAVRFLVISAPTTRGDRQSWSRTIEAES